MAGRDTRIIFSDNGSLVEITNEIAEYFTGSYVLPFVTAEDYLYCGSFFPFNHKWVKVDVANTNVSSLQVDHWDGKEWKACVDIIDQTKVSGVALAQDGIISWVPEKKNSWDREDTNNEGQTVTGLTSLNIYDLYWVRMKWSADLSVTTAIKYFGYKFATDAMLGAEYPDLNNSTARTAFNQGIAGKNDWEEQHVVAAEAIITDLKVTNTIVHPGQILDWDVFTKAAVHKCAQIIYNSFGDDYKDNRDQAQKLYDKEMANSFKRLDWVADGKLTVTEGLQPNIGRVYR